MFHSTLKLAVLVNNFVSSIIRSYVVIAYICITGFDCLSWVLVYIRYTTRCIIPVFVVSHRKADV